MLTIYVNYGSFKGNDRHKAPIRDDQPLLEALQQCFPPNGSDIFRQVVLCRAPTFGSFCSTKFVRVLKALPYVLLGSTW